MYYAGAATVDVDEIAVVAEMVAGNMYVATVACVVATLGFLIRLLMGLHQKIQH